MLASQLSQIVRNDRLMSKEFLGIYSKDTLPPTHKFAGPCTLLVNSQDSWEIGEHWLLAKFTSGKSHVYWFDSLAPDRALEPPFEDWLLGCGAQLIANARKVQEDHSQLCGAYCIDMLYHLSRGVDFSDALNYFHHQDLSRNEMVVKKFFSQNFTIDLDHMIHGHHMCDKNVDFAQTCCRNMC